MELHSLAVLQAAVREQGKPLWELVLETDMDNRMVSREASLAKMRTTWKAMVEASESYVGSRRSRSGLVGGDGERMRRFAAEHETIGGSLTADVIGEALAMGENNACMCRIVAAPTAGACGTMPAVLLPLWRREKISEEKMLEALYTAAGIGTVIASRACISGAAGGCQAEVGSASAMAAGALVCLRGGDVEQICHAVAMALKMVLGLACDPVAGLVEVPCVKRNVMGAMNAIAAADMALAGIQSQIPVDEVIDAMGEIGRRLPMELRETALGGLAATPTGKSVKQWLEDSGKN